MKLKLKKENMIWLISAGSILGAILFGVLIGLLIPGKEPEEAPKKEEIPAAEEPILEESTIAPEDFIYQDGFLTCTTAPSVLGIDVSGFQGDIDWQQVKQAGVEFAMIRVGGRFYGSNPELYDDSKAPSNYRGAKAAGLKVGAYFFSQATTPEEARQEALYALELTKDWQMDMPLVCDWEYMGPGTYGENVDAETLTACIREFCKTVQAGGRKPMVYFNPDHSQNQLNLEELAEYDFWLALYANVLDYPYQVDMWQYTDAGVVPGIAGNVDINLYFPPQE